MNMQTGQGPRPRTNSAGPETETLPPRGPSNTRRQPAEPADPAVTLRACTPIGAVEITHNAAGCWKVVLGGFSRSANQCLTAALAEATGTNRDTPWILKLAHSIQEQTAPQPRA